MFAFFLNFYLIISYHAFLCWVFSNVAIIIVVHSLKKLQKLDSLHEDSVHARHTRHTGCITLSIYLGCNK